MVSPALAIAGFTLKVERSLTFTPLIKRVIFPILGFTSICFESENGRTSILHFLLRLPETISRKTVYVCSSENVYVKVGQRPSSFRIPPLILVHQMKLSREGTTQLGSFTLVARNVTVRGAFPSIGEASICQLICSICALETKVLIPEIRLATSLVDPGFFSASWR